MKSAQEHNLGERRVGEAALRLPLLHQAISDTGIGKVRWAVFDGREAPAATLRCTVHCSIPRSPEAATAAQSSMTYPSGSALCSGAAMSGKTLYRRRRRPAWERSLRWLRQPCPGRTSANSVTG